jgi:hypothetical protein
MEFTALETKGCKCYRYKMALTSYNLLFLTQRIGGCPDSCVALRPMVDFVVNAPRLQGVFPCRSVFSSLCLVFV